MRLFALSSEIILLSLATSACATYESEGGSLGGDPSMLGGGGSGGEAMNMAGSAAGSAGSKTSAGGTTTQAGSGSMPMAGGGMGAGGTQQNAGGASAGVGGVTSGGSAGSDAGSGGKAGAGGSAGSGGKAGSGGTGGTGPVVTCSSNPLSARSSWTITASHSSLGNGMESDALYNPTSHMVDDDLSERWSTGKSQSGDEWMQVDFGKVVTLSDVTLQHGEDTADYPRNYAVRVSNASQDFNATVRASGAGTEQAALAIALPALATGRYLTIRQTGAVEGKWWSIAELQVSCSD